MPAQPLAVRLRQRGDFFRRLVADNPAGVASRERDQSAGYARRRQSNAIADVGSIPTVSISEKPLSRAAFPRNEPSTLVCLHRGTRSERVRSMAEARRSFEGSCRSTATPDEAWAVWTDPDSWPGGPIETARIDGAFEVGSKITTKVKGNRRLTSTITRIDAPHL